MPSSKEHIHHNRWQMPIYVLILFAVLTTFGTARNVSAQQWANNGNNIYNTNSGNVGVGISTPSATLHVVGANGPSNNTAAPAPDALQVIGGVGGNGTWGASAGGIGGAINLTGGTGGAPVAGYITALGGKGGSINLTGGTGGPNTFNVGGGAGGDVLLNGGVGVANSAGNVILANLRGNVGIGTASPNRKLDLVGDVGGLSFEAGSGSPNSGAIRFGDNTGWKLHFGRSRDGVGGVLNSGTSGVLMTIQDNGNVGIGTTSPGVALEVAQNRAIRLGNANLSSGGDYVHLSNHAWYNGSAWQFDSSPGALYQISGQTHNWYKHDGVNFTNLMSLSNSGNLTVSGNLAAKYQDVAEWVPTSQKLAPGTVVVLDAERGSDVVASTQAYDTKVAGVVSARPGLALGEAGEDKVLVATTGRVKVKVDATRAPIRVGDLLVTSETKGCAMKSEPIIVSGRSIHSPGTLIGKALEPLEKGVGEIMVLLSLQ